MPSIPPLLLAGSNLAMAALARVFVGTPRFSAPDFSVMPKPQHRWRY